MTSAGLTAAAAEGVAAFGHLDVVVANAGVCIMKPWDQITVEDWQQTISVNLTGTWNTVMATAPHLVSAGGGSIILTSSVAGLKGLPFMVPYVASKHGVTGSGPGLRPGTRKGPHPGQQHPPERRQTR